MSLWEYKVITSGKGGFATPALLEKFLNDLGRDEWEIVHFQTPTDNFLAFTGLARRSTQRDWTLEDAAAAAAKVEADKLRAEFEAKFKSAAGNAPAGGEERVPSFLEEKVAPDDGFRKPVDTSHDDDPDAQEEDKADEWDKLTAAEEDELPTFFEAIKPHMRRNQRGPGMSVGVDYLAKKWDQSEDDLKAALGECGFVVPTDEDAKAEYVEYDGDLYWLNVNRRGELWINTKEKPRPVFRPVKAARIEVEQPAGRDGNAKDGGNAAAAPRPESSERKPEVPDAPDGEAERSAAADEREKPAAVAPRNAKSEPAPAQLPEGILLLDRIRPHMRRNRRGPGGSGSASFLSRALRTNEADLRTAFSALGLTVPSTPADKPVYSEIGNEVWWLNLDSRGGLWINGREKKEGESLTTEPTGEAPLEAVPGSAAADAVPAPEVVPAVASAGDFQPGRSIETPAAETAPDEHTRIEISGDAPANPGTDFAPRDAEAARTSPTKEPEPSDALAAVRQLLKETRSGSAAAKVDQLAGEMGKPPEEFVATLVNAGFRIPEKPRDKPVFIEHAGEMLWLNRNPKGELWLNAKASKLSGKESDSEDAEENGEPSEGGEGEGEKKPVRRAPRPRTKKAEPKENPEEKVES